MGGLVVHGRLAADESGKSRSKWSLWGEGVSFIELFNLLATLRITHSDAKASVGLNLP